MTDDIYYQYLPMIRKHVARMVRPDTHLSTIHREVRDDIESFAYAYFADLQKRFGNDEEVAKYYLSTINSRISKYIIKYYKQRSPGSNRKITFVHFDAYCYEDDNRPTTMWDRDPLVRVDKSLTADQEEQEEKLLYEHMRLALIDCAPLKHRDLISEVIDRISDIDGPPNGTGKGFATELGEKYGCARMTVHNVWFSTKNKFKLLYPEAVEYMKNGDPDLIDVLMNKFKSQNILRKI